MLDMAACMKRVIDLLEEYTESRRAPILAECRDLPRLSDLASAVVVWGEILATGDEMAKGIALVVEIAYVMGVERGRSERIMEVRVTE